MSNTAALTDLEEIARDPFARDTPVRAQVAFVRTLIHESRRIPAVDPRAGAVSQQVDEELTRLKRMVCDRASEPPRPAAPSSGAGTADESR